MVTGRLRDKRGIYQIILPYIDINNNKQEKSISTGLQVKNNKRKAESILQIVEQLFDPTNSDLSIEFIKRHIKNGTLFDINYGDYQCEIEKAVKAESERAVPLFTEWLHTSLEHWLMTKKKGNKDITYAGYLGNIEKTIVPFFKELERKLRKPLLVSDVTVNMIEQFYYHCVVENKNTVHTLKHYIVDLNRAFKYAQKCNFIEKNPLDFAERPKDDKTFQGQACTDEQAELIFNFARDTKLELPILLAAYYGCRRGETLAVRESAVDFENNTITIDKTVSEYKKDGEKIVEIKPFTKNGIIRTYPLYEEIRDCILRVKKRNEEYREIFGNSYCDDYLDCYNVDEFGQLIKPSYISRYFAEFLDKSNIPRYRFHDLRHTCGTKLYKATRDLLLTQKYMRHNKVTTTEIYVHLSNEQMDEASNVFIDGYSPTKKALKPKKD